jgi:hypothetical protein
LIDFSPQLWGLPITDAISLRNKLPPYPSWLVSNARAGAAPRRNKIAAICFIFSFSATTSRRN